MLCYCYRSDTFVSHMFGHNTIAQFCELLMLQFVQASAVRLTMMVQGLLTVFAVTSLRSAAGSTVRMMNSSLTVREGETVSVCVVATLSAGESVEVGLTSSNNQG